MEEEDLTKGGDPSPRLLDLIPRDKTWMVRDKERVIGGGGGGGSKGMDSEEEIRLELTLGLPGGEDYVKEEKAEEESSILSLGYFPKAPKTNSSVVSGSKRGAFGKFEPNPVGIQQQQSGFFQLKNRANSGKELSTKASGKACFFPPAQDGGSKSSRTRNTAPVVGWPPVRSFRKNLASSSSSKPSSEPPNSSSETGLKPENARKGSLVKINMDGIPIGRKVDLKACDSYEKLASAVEELFRGLLEARRDPSLAKIIEDGQVEQPFSGLLDGTGEYTLVYEDFDGDKLLVGDVPWDEFVSMAKRLRVQKTSEISAIPSEAVRRRTRTAKGC